MKKILLGVIFCMLLMMISCSPKDKVQPEEVVIRSFESLFESGAIDTSTTLKITTDTEELEESGLLNNIGVDENIVLMVMDLMNQVTLKTDYQYIFDENQMILQHFLNFALQYNEENILDLSFLTNGYDTKLKMPSLSDMVLTYDASEVEDVFQSLDASKYSKIFYDKTSETYLEMISTHPYRDYFSGFLKSRIEKEKDSKLDIQVDGKTETIDVSLYAFNFDDEDVFTVWSDMLKMISEDEALKAHLKYIFSSIMNELLESEDYLLTELSKDDLIFAIENHDVEFDRLWDEIFEEFTSEDFDGMEIFLDELGIKSNYDNGDFKIKPSKVAIMIDEQGVLRGISIKDEDVTIGLQCEFVVNAYGDQVKINDISGEPVDLVDVFNTAQVNPIENMSIGKAFVLEGYASVLENKGVKDLIDDISVYTKFLGYGTNEIYDLIENARSTIEDYSDAYIYETLFGTQVSYEDYDKVGSSSYSDEKTIDSIIYYADHYENYYDDLWSNSLRNYQEAYGFDLKTYQVETEYIDLALEENKDEAVSLYIFENEWFAPYVLDFASQHPESMFIFLGYYVEDYTENMIFVTFYDEDLAYLVGYMAGLTSETGKVAVISDYNDYEALNRGQAFLTGAYEANPQIEVIENYLEEVKNYDEGFNDGTMLIESGVDVIYSVADAYGGGIIQAAEEHNVKFILQDYPFDIDYSLDLATEYIDTDRMVDWLLYLYTVNNLENFIGFGVAEDVLYLNIDTSLLTVDNYEKIIEQTSRIIDGEIVVEQY